MKLSNNHFHNTCFAVGQKGMRGEPGQSCNNTKGIERIEETMLEIKKNNGKLNG